MRTLVIGALACALSVSACSKVGEISTSGGVARGPGTVPGELRVATQRSPNTLNPILSANTTEGFINRLSFDTLVSVDGSGKNTVPVLATEVPTEANGGISKDGLTITYHLHSGVRWHDGVPFSSKDVKFTWQAMMNNANNVNERVGYEDVKSVDTPDAKPWCSTSSASSRRSSTRCSARATARSASSPSTSSAKFPNLNRIPFNQQPIGTGPFKVARWVRGDHIELVANDDYFLGKPKLRRIVVREIPDENTSLNALRSHDVDWIFEASPQLYKTIKARPSSDITVVLNNQPQTLQMLVNTSRPPLDDLRIRRALAYAIDKQSLVDKNTAGSATVAWADQPPFQWSYTDDVMKYPADAAKSRALLAEAGYTPGPTASCARTANRCRSRSATTSRTPRAASSPCRCRRC